MSIDAVAMYGNFRLAHIRAVILNKVTDQVEGQQSVSSTIIYIYIY
jgi:hypothetical protein